MEEKTTNLNFIEQIIEHDLSVDAGKAVLTRFPPEPNGYLHIGHAKSICLNFGIAEKYQGKTNLRFDDTNPVTEETEFVNSIKKDIKWLGFDWEEREYYASDYFEQLYEMALQLIRKGKAYVDDSNPDIIAEEKGTPTVPGKDSQYRSRSIEENLDLFMRMKSGEFEEGTSVLRAKIDMASPNMLMRDPVIYRIKFAKHHRTGDTWCIYPMYDFAHGQSDALEEITYSLCTLEFENHRPLYDWFIETLELFPSRQIEFARLNVDYMITSKRKLKKLVEEGIVSGWDDPRMPTISGMRRRGYTPNGIKAFCDKIGIAKRENIIEMSLLEFCIREDLNKVAPRIMAVLNPIELRITNLSADHAEDLSIVNNPEDPEAGERTMPFSRTLYIERDDFMEDPPRKYFRLAPGRVVRLKGAYIIECTHFDKDEDGNVTAVYAEMIPNSRSGSDTSGVKAKGTIHWVDANTCLNVEVRLYDRLFSDPDPTGHEEKDFMDFLNSQSMEVLPEVKMEANFREAGEGRHFQFLRKGYFMEDYDSTDSQVVFNRTVTLRDSWKKK